MAGASSVKRVQEGHVEAGELDDATTWPKG